MPETLLPDAAPPALDVSGLDVHLGRGSGRAHVVDGVSLHIRVGEALGVIGETGSGKSTIARTVLGLVRPSAGTIRIGGRDVTRLPSRARRAFRRSGVAQYVFQDPLRSLDPDLTIGGSIAEPLLLQGRLGRADVREAVRRQAEDVRLDPALLSRFPAEISGGQRQRAAIARALVTRPRLLILDEPVSALDSANRVKILELLQSLRSSEVALLFISHDLGSVAGLTDRTLVLHRGRAVEVGDTPQIVNAPRHPYTRQLLRSAPSLTSAP